MLYRYVCVNVRCISLGSLSIYLYTELCVWMSGVYHWVVWVSTCTLSCVYVNVRCISLGSLSIYLYTELCVCECQVYLTGQSEYLPVHWAMCMWMSGVYHWAVWVSTCTLSCVMAASVPESTKLSMSFSALSRFVNLIHQPYYALFVTCLTHLDNVESLQCLDNVGWVTGRTCGL